MEADEILIAAHILNDQRDAEEQAAVPGRTFLDAQNPFETLSDRQFRRYFRLSKHLARQVIDLLAPHMQQGRRKSAISVERNVLVALKFFGTGSYQEIVGTNLYTAVRQATVSRSIKEVADALNRPEIFNQWVKFPRNLQEFETLRTRFYQKYNFPGILGCIDCTHVAIVAPPRNDPAHPENIYVNRKNYHSINVQLICDDNLKILNVNARYPGSTHDAFIWRQSQVSLAMENVYRQDPNNPFFLLGDSGYPLRPWLLTPLRNVEENSPEERFNNRLKQVRSIIERCNGVLKNRFRCLLTHRVLHYRPEKAASIINACVVLHNMCIDANEPIPEDDDDQDLHPDRGLYDIEDEEDHNLRRVNPDLVEARRLQRRIINNFFA